METVNAIVPSDFWPDANVTARRNKAQKMASLDRFLMFSPFTWGEQCLPFCRLRLSRRVCAWIRIVRPVFGKTQKLLSSVKKPYKSQSSFFSHKRLIIITLNRSVDHPAPICVADLYTFELFPLTKLSFQSADFHGA
jgi:hypothetical protein